MPKLARTETMTAEAYRALPKTRSRKNDGNPEELLARQLTGLKIPFERQFRFHETRKWRVDFWVTAPDRSGGIIAEVDGGIWSKNHLGHNRGSGIYRDMEKQNEAVCAGYRVLRFDSTMVEKGIALEFICRALGIVAVKSNKNWKANHFR